MVAFSFGCGVRWSEWDGEACCRSGAAEVAVGDRPRAAADGDHAGLDELLDAERLEHVEEGAELVRGAGRLDDDRIGGDVDDLGLEELDSVDDLAAGRCVGADLDEQDLPLDRRVRLELDDLEHLDELVELLGDLLQGGALDLDDHRQGVLAHAQSSRSQTGASWRAAWIMSLLTPAGTMGHTMASRCTMKSMTTGRSFVSSACLMTASTSSGVSARRPRQP